MPTVRLPCRLLEGLRVVAALALALVTVPALPQAAAPQAGPVDLAFAGVDRLMREYLAQRAFPGGVVVIAHGERIIYAQGYGWADVQRQVPASPWLEWRLASLSKPFTAVAVLRLVEQGKVALDAPAWNYVAASLGVEPSDARLRQVTVRQLLTHTWGLDRAVSADPMGGYYRDGSATVSGLRPMLRYHLARMQLDFAPGARYAYNNTGFGWLHLIAEVVDGRPLERQITELMGAEPLSSGIARFGDVNPARLTDAEARYYDYAGAPLRPPVPGVYGEPAPAQVPRPEGSYTLDGYGGAGGLIASPLTVTRFVQRLLGARAPALLQPATLAQMLTEVSAGGSRTFYGLGVQASAIAGWAAGDRLVGHTGSIAGVRNAWRATPRRSGGPVLTVMVQTNGTPVGQGSEAVDNIHAEIVDPVIFEVDRIANHTQAPEIAADRLIAWGSASEAWFADLLFDWAERVFPPLFPARTAAGEVAGFRLRYYAATDTYLGVKEGRVWLYQASANPAALINVAALAELLPQAMRESIPAGASGAPRPGAAR